MTREHPKPDQPTHADLWEEIRTVERDLKRLVLGVAGGISLAGFSAFLTVWQDATEAAQIVGGVSAQVSHNVAAVAEALESQRRVEQGLAEINRYLREDSREQREALQQHVRSGHPGGRP